MYVCMYVCMGSGNLLERLTFDKGFVGDIRVNVTGNFQENRGSFAGPYVLKRPGLTPPMVLPNESLSKTHTIM